jgi:prepilin-type N-terminal cleavage/methylation domain-containing protein
MQNFKKTKGFTIVELMVVISVIAILSALLITAVTRSLSAAKTAEAQNRLREIHTLMQGWSGSNNGRVLPSQFNFTDEAAAGSAIRIRSDVHLRDDQYIGTWTDILWTDNEMYKTYGLHETELEDNEHLRWKTDSPGADIYSVRSSFDNPFRSTMPNSRNTNGQTPRPTPFGDGANEIEMQGYFAANDFFDSRSDADGHPDADDAQGAEPSKVDRYYSYGMLDAPSKSLYLVDSIAGETIAHKTITGMNDESAWLHDFGKGSISLNDSMQTNSDPTGQIDYRYGSEDGSCLILLLDGHVSQETPWVRLGLDNPQANGAPDKSTLQGRGIRVGNLTKKVR